MYVLLIYDVNAKRDAKVLKCCRKYLSPVQKSAFEGFITESLLGELKNGIKQIVCPEEDSVYIYELESPRYAKKENLGKISDMDNILM